MKQLHKAIIKKSIGENLPKAHFINLKFTGAIGGWEANVSDKEFCRYTITRGEENGEITYFVESRLLEIGNCKRKPHEAPFLKTKIEDLNNLNCPVFEDWLMMSDPKGAENKEKLQERKNGIIKFIADDLYNTEMEKMSQAFIASL